MKWLKDNWKAIGIITLGLLLPMLIINFTMDLSLFDSLSNADDSAWLGFWGGYLGAIISIGGLYWQTNKQIKLEIKNRKETTRRQDQQIQQQEANRNEDIERQRDQYYNEARAIFAINVARGIDQSKIPHNYMSSQCEEIDGNLGTNWPLGIENLPLLKIDNFSDNPMLAVKVVLFDKNKQIADEFYINRINSVDTAKLISTFTVNWYEKYIVGTSENFLGKYDPNNYISKIKLFYTTNKGEQVLKEFVKFKENEFKLVKTCNQYQPGQKNIDALYSSTKNISESKLYHGGTEFFRH